MKAKSNKNKAIYFFFAGIVLFIVANYYLDNKYKAKSNNASIGTLAKENRVTKNEQSTSNSVVKENSLPENPETTREMQLPKDHRALTIPHKSENSNIKDAYGGKNLNSLKGALVIYNRMPANIIVNVIKPDGKKISKLILSQKSIQMDVPMGVYSIQATDSKNNPISDGKVTVGDALGAVYYVK